MSLWFDRRRRNAALEGWVGHEKKGRGRLVGAPGDQVDL